MESHGLSTHHKMPVHRISKNQRTAQLTALGTQQRRPQPPSQLPNQAITNGLDQLHDLSPFELSELFEPSQVLGTQVGDIGGEPFTQGGPSIADFTLLDEVMREIVEKDLNEDTCSQQQTKSQPAKLELLNIDEWDEEKTYDEDPPSCIHYLIE